MIFRFFWQFSSCTVNSANVLDAKLFKAWHETHDSVKHIINYNKNNYTILNYLIFISHIEV
jgi:hypothetical protein